MEEYLKIEGVLEFLEYNDKKKYVSQKLIVEAIRTYFMDIIKKEINNIYISKIKN